MDHCVDPLEFWLARDLRDTWQGRALKAGKRHPLGSVVLSMIAHTWETEHVLCLLKAVFPEFTAIKAPFLCSAGSIDKAGRIYATAVMADGQTRGNVVLFSSEIDMRDQFRKFADRIRLTDKEREQMFICLRKWVVADFRLDPNMNPADPDAKRLRLH